MERHLAGEAIGHPNCWDALASRPGLTGLRQHRPTLHKCKGGDWRASESPVEIQYAALGAHTLGLLRECSEATIADIAGMADVECDSLGVDQALTVEGAQFDGGLNTAMVPDQRAHRSADRRGQFWNHETGAALRTTRSIGVSFRHQGLGSPTSFVVQGAHD
jgi:hypothetical protein